MKIKGMLDLSQSFPSDPIGFHSSLDIIKKNVTVV